ncbi:MAG: hypothetical protein ACTSU2_17015 [Promethearchaeota archaeon]
MQVQIDDSMWGELIGGVLIGFYIPKNRNGVRVLTHKYIDVYFFQGARFRNKEYIKRAYELTKEFFREQNVQKTDELLLCRGYLMKEVGSKLIIEGYNVKFVKIVGVLQNYLVNQNHKKLLEIIKDPSFFHQKGSQFDRLVRWVNKDLKNRERFVKTGWKKWAKYRGNKNY